MVTRMTYDLRTRRAYEFRAYRIPPHYLAIQARLRDAENESAARFECGLCIAAIIAATLVATLLLAI